MSAVVEIGEYGLRGEPARLIPVGPDSQKEKKATSALLSSLQSVHEFGRDLLSSIGAKASRKSRISCFTEVCLQEGAGDRIQRPDGLIVVSYGNRRWAAVVEAKVGTEELSPVQVEAYLELARDAGIDAVITISNQFVPSPAHSPVAVHAGKLRSVKLFHWSWRYIISHALLAQKNQEIADPDQAYILTELVRYLEHESSGVRSFTQMGPSWKEVCTDIHQGKRLLRTSPSAVDAAKDWIQLARFLSLEIGLAVGRQVAIYLTPRQRKTPDVLYADVVEELTSEGSLTAGFEIPNAAGTLWLKVDLNRRKLVSWMSLDAPADRKQPKAAVTWLLRQIKDVEVDGILLHAFWAYKSTPAIVVLTDVRKDPEVLLEANPGVVPKRFEVVWPEDLAGDVGRSRVFVDAAERVVLGFYREVGQNLKPWVPPPPRVQDEASDGSSEPAVKEDTSSQSPAFQAQADGEGATHADRIPRGGETVPGRQLGTDSTGDE